MVTPERLYRAQPAQFDAFGYVWRFQSFKVPYHADWRSGPVWLSVFDDGTCGIGTDEGPDGECFPDVQRAYESALAAGVDFSSCETTPSTDGSTLQTTGCTGDQNQAGGGEKDE